MRYDDPLGATGSEESGSEGNMFTGFKADEIQPSVPARLRPSPGAPNSSAQLHASRVRLRVVRGKPVVALDIDGTLGDYHRHFIEFARLWTGRDLPDPADINNGEPLHKHLGMSKTTYRQCKLAYRQGQMKRSMPVYEGAAELSRGIRRVGGEVWICTTRPYLRLDTIDPDTRHWLRRNGIQFDGVLYGEHKYSDLTKIVGRDRIVAVLDDLPEVLDRARGLGLECYLRDQPYNRYRDDFTRVTSFGDFSERIESVIKNSQWGKR
jgi:hypothetical protein